MIKHPIPPIYNQSSKTLILGSFPSVKSREAEFFYGHPQNRFWKVLSGVFDSDDLNTVEEKKAFLCSNGIALWDVIASCNIVGSADSKISDIVPNDISIILNSCEIKNIFVNGKVSQKVYDRYIKDIVNREAVYLPSTSSANAVYSLADLINEWSVIKD